MLKTKILSRPALGLVFSFGLLILLAMTWPQSWEWRKIAPDKALMDSLSATQSRYPAFPRKPHFHRGSYPNRKHSDPNHPYPTKAPRLRIPEIIRLDINMADSIDWVQVPGIGAKTAHRILRYRNRLRGFVRIEQLLEVAYFDSNLLASNRVQFTLSPDHFPGLYWDSIQSTHDLYHPYLSSLQRKSLFRYKVEHPRFHPLTDPKPLCIDSATWLSMAPYWR